MLVNQLTSKSIMFFLERCKRIGIPDDELETIYAIAQTSVKYYTGSGTVRVQMREWQVLERTWYQSLADGNPWYKIYGAKYYIADLWACWVVYSRKYLKSLYDCKALGDHSIMQDLSLVTSVADLGCGVGITTAALAQMFPKASCNIYGTNLLGTQQADFCLSMSKEYNFNLQQDVALIGRKCDLVFASEYFEHFYKPIEHLQYIIANLNPDYLITANAFGTKSIGHFDCYMVEGRLLDAKQTARAFSNAMHMHGYNKVKTRLWNNRPAYWRKPAVHRGNTDNG